MRKCLVICPVYNEEKTIEEFYRRLRRVYKDDVLFIDDGSDDKSSDFLYYIESRENLVLRSYHRKGYGASLIAGFNFALHYGYTDIITIDVDLQHNPEDILVFRKALSTHNIVLGSRYIKMGDLNNIPRDRLLINRYIAGLLEKVFNVKVSDPFCGFRGYKNTFLRKIVLKDKSYGLGLEIILEIIRLKEPFVEISIEMIYKDRSRIFLDGLEHPRQRLLYYLNLIAEKKKEILYEEKV